MGPIVVQALVIAVATVPSGFDLDPFGALASVNPIRCVTDAERASFAGDVASRATLAGFVAAAVPAAAGLAVGMRSMRRST